MMNPTRPPPAKGGDKNKHPDYAAMAETLESLAADLALRAQAEGDAILAGQSERLRLLAAAIRYDLAESA